MVLDDYNIIFNLIQRKHQLHLLICIKTNRVLAASNWSQTIRSLEPLPNTHAWYSTLPILQFPKAMNLNLPFDHVYDVVSQKLYKKELEEHEIMHYLLISEKSSVLDFLHKKITALRVNLLPSLAYQNIIDDAKYKEAVDYISGKSHSEHPYLESYAKIMSLTKQEAANTIIAKQNISNSSLVQTEEVRLEYTKRVLEAEDLISLNATLDNLNKQLSVYGAF
jgi:hypothetical protein